MAISILIQFSENRTLEIKEYSTINMSRNGRVLDINITNVNNDLALNAIYDKIVDLQGDTETFSIAVEAGENSKAEFSGIISNYYNSGETEILHLATKNEALC